MKATIYIDGACRGSPAACAAVVLVEGLPEKEFALFWGRLPTISQNTQGLFWALSKPGD